MSHCPTREKYFLQSILWEDFNKTKLVCRVLLSTVNRDLLSLRQFSAVSSAGTALPQSKGKGLLARASSRDQRDERIFRFLLSDFPPSFLTQNSGSELLAQNSNGGHFSSCEYSTWYNYSWSFRNFFFNDIRRNSLF